MKKIVLLLLLAPLLMISFVAEFGVLIAASPSIVRVPDDYEKIQWAIGNASDGDTIFVRAEHTTSM